YNPEPPKVGVRRAIATDPLPDTLFKPASALRHGAYKLLHDYETGRDELYDLRNDLGELRDLAAVNQRLTATLRQRLDAALRRVKARRPSKNEQFQP
ncbi:MAG: arylsulfatase, partial [Acidobacteria bacterium]|nr:arylsulfatase [Acidobacteriota bacterium]